MLPRSLLCNSRRAEACKKFRTVRCSTTPSRVREVAEYDVGVGQAAGWAEDSCKEQCARGDGGAGRGQLQMPHELDVYTRLGQRVGARGSARYARVVQRAPLAMKGDEVA